MIQQAFHPAKDSDEWRWSLDVATYDRSPYLHSREHEELILLMHRFQARRTCWPKRTYRELQRLLHPLNDVLNLIGCHISSRRGTLRLMLGEMHRRQQSFWGWTKEEWLETLCPDATAFELRYHRGKDCRPGMMAVAYLLCGFSDILALGQFYQPAFARKVFGSEAVDATLERARKELLRLGFGATLAHLKLPYVLCTAMLVNRSPRLEDLTIEVLETVRNGAIAPSMRRDFVALSRALVSLGILPKALESAKRGPETSEETLQAVPAAWLQWCQHWYDTCTQARKTRNGIYTQLLKVGRWLAQTHPDITSPEDWTRELAAEFVAAVDRMTVGQWAHPHNIFIPAEKRGKPLAPNSKVAQISALRVFFRECQEWGWLPRRFDPRRSLAAPRSIRALTAPNPRVIADDIWAIICTRTP